MWLISQGVAAPGRPTPAIIGYWGLAQRFAACLGWGALAAAGACGAWILLRDTRGATSPQAEAIIGAAAIGAPLLLIGTGMGAVWSIAGDGGPGTGGPGLTLPALLAALALLAWVRWRSPNPRRLAWVAVVAVAVSATGLLTGSLTGEFLN
jgi:cytochrome bd-type quinol oxidase subunit 2